MGFALKNFNSLRRKIDRLTAKLQRSRRSNNPQNYEKDGTIKKGVKLKWVCSKNYFKILKQLKEAYRLKAAKLNLSHRKLANALLEPGANIYVETMNYKALAKRAKETKVSEKIGRIKPKGRFGKSIGNYAPAKVLLILEQKLKYVGLRLNKVNTVTFKASQYNHSTNIYKKKKLSQRWTVFDGHKMQRDLYSAFLLMCSKASLKKCDREKCLKYFDKFKALHDKEIARLQLSVDKLPSSFGIRQEVC